MILLSGVLCIWPFRWVHGVTLGNSMTTSASRYLTTLLWDDHRVADGKVGNRLKCKIVSVSYRSRLLKLLVSMLCQSYDKHYVTSLSNVVTLRYRNITNVVFGYKVTQYVMKFQFDGRNVLNVITYKTRKDSKMFVKFLIDNFNLTNSPLKMSVVLWLELLI